MNAIIEEDLNHEFHFEGLPILDPQLLMMLQQNEPHNEVHTQGHCHHSRMSRATNLNLSKASINRTDIVVSSQDRQLSRIVKGTTTSRLSVHRGGTAT